MAAWTVLSADAIASTLVPSMVVRIDKIRGHGGMDAK
jgi:hypothetical protein